MSIWSQLKRWWNTDELGRPIPTAAEVEEARGEYLAALSVEQRQAALLQEIFDGQQGQFDHL